MFLAALFVLVLGVVLQGVGYWERSRSPVLYWSTMTAFGFMAFAGAFRLVTG
jgi:hypothetical protein